MGEKDEGLEPHLWVVLVRREVVGGGGATADCSRRGACFAARVHRRRWGRGFGSRSVSGGLGRWWRGSLGQCGSEAAGLRRALLTGGNGGWRKENIAARATRQPGVSIYSVGGFEVKQLRSGGRSIRGLAASRCRRRPEVACRAERAPGRVARPRDAKAPWFRQNRGRVGPLGRADGHAPAGRGPVDASGVRRHDRERVEGER